MQKCQNKWFQALPGLKIHLPSVFGFISSTILRFFMSFSIFRVRDEFRSAAYPENPNGCRNPPDGATKYLKYTRETCFLMLSPFLQSILT